MQRTRFSDSSPFTAVPLPSPDITLLASDPKALPPQPSADVTRPSSPAQRKLDIPIPRCSAKGCVFPAASIGGNLCLLHHLAEEEPKHFLSIQPSSFCLERAKFGTLGTAAEKKRSRLEMLLRHLCNKVA